MLELKKMRPAAGFLVLSLGFGIAACSSNNDGPTDGAPGGTDDGGMSGCAHDPRVEMLTANLTHKGKSGISFVITKSQLVGATSDPTFLQPQAGQNNQWTLKILDANGQPTKGAMVTFPILGDRPSDPWMPDHSHPAAHAMATPNPDGTFNISPLYFFMGGVWSTYVQAQVGSVTDSTTFTVCAG